MPVSIHLSYVLGDLPFAERFETARALGFDAVEFPFPYDTPAADYRRLLDDNGLTQIAVGTPASDYRHGEPGWSVTPAHKARFDASVETAIAYAKAIGCPRVHVFAGPLAPDVSRELGFETYCANIADAHARLRREGLTLVVEPINPIDFPGYFLDRLDLAVAMIAATGCHDIGIVLDVYHAAVNGEDVHAFLRDYGGQVTHVQLADFPGRHEPGSAGIDFTALFDTLRTVGYRGSIGLEYVPTRSVADGVPLATELGVTAR